MPALRVPRGGICKRCGEAYEGHYQTHRAKVCTNKLEWGKKGKKTGLTPRQKQVFEMKSKIGVDGRVPTNAEIAEKLGVHKLTVTQTLVNARKRVGGLPTLKLTALGKKPKPMDVYEYVRGKLLTELVARVKDKKKVELIPNEEVLAMLKGVSQGMQIETDLSRGGGGNEVIRVNADHRMFEETEGAEEPEDVDATEEAFQPPEETT